MSQTIRQIKTSVPSSPYPNIVAASSFLSCKGNSLIYEFASILDRLADRVCAISLTPDFLVKANSLKLGETK